MRNDPKPLLWLFFRKFAVGINFDFPSFGDSRDIACIGFACRLDGLGNDLHIQAVACGSFAVDGCAAVDEYGGRVSALHSSFVVIEAVFFKPLGVVQADFVIGARDGFDCQDVPVFRILPRHHDDGADVDGVACVPYLHGDVLLFRVGIKGLRDTLSFELAVARYSEDKSTVMNGGLMTNPNTGASKFEYQDLPPELARQIYSMKEGDVSMPFTMMDRTKNKEVCAIVRLKTKRDAHKANLTDDFQTIRNMLIQEQKTQTIDQWIRNKQQDIYVHIDPAWVGCDFQYPNWVK